jgi:hypothetical protein
MDESAVEAEMESRGETDAESQKVDGESQKPDAKRRKRPSAPTGKTRSRNYYVTDEVHDRLLLYARERKLTLSAAANHVLHLGLPKYEVKRVS